MTNDDNSNLDVPVPYTPCDQEERRGPWKVENGRLRQTPRIETVAQVEATAVQETPAAERAALDDLSAWNPDADEALGDSLDDVLNELVDDGLSERNTLADAEDWIAMQARIDEIVVLATAQRQLVNRAIDDLVMAIEGRWRRRVEALHDRELENGRREFGQLLKAAIANVFKPPGDVNDIDGDANALWEARFEPAAGSWKCRAHDWQDENGGVCPSCARYAFLAALQRPEEPRPEAHGVDPVELHIAFHVLWTKAVDAIPARGASTYDKEEWLALDRMLTKLGAKPTTAR